ncbi:hypothetical protein JTE90_017430, partial [Oedothorax gibbosus]
MGSLKACIALFCLLFFQIESIETGEGNRTCSNDSLPCDDGECVSRGKWCDGKKNCKDESDEAYCKKKSWWVGDDPNFCEGTHFLCNIGHCIPLVGKCDGFEDCKDKSDEWNCEPKKTRDDYGDNLLLTTTSLVPTETTSVESTDIRDGLEKDDIETTTQSSLPIFTKVAQLETIRPDVPSSTTLSTSALKIPETVPTSSQVTIKNTTSTKPLPPATHQTIPHPQTWKASSNPVLTSMKSDPGKESQHPLTSISSSYGAANQNQPISSFPKTITHSYHHQTQPIKPQESMISPISNFPKTTIEANHHQTLPIIPQEFFRTHFENQQRVRQRSSSTLQQHYNARQPSEIIPRAYDPRRISYQYQSQVSRPSSYVGQPTGQVDQSHVTITGATIHGFQVYRVISSDRKRYYEGYYNQYGQFVTTYPNEGQERYPRPRTEPPRRHRPPPLTISTAAPLSFDRKLKAPSRFYFAKDYTRTYLRENAEYIDRGRAWILSNRDAEGGWGSETPRALIALSLINNSFINETYENNIMQKHFQVFLGTSLIRGDTKTTSINRLAMSVNALIATCQNPRDFHGTDYTELVRKRLREQLRNSQHHRNEVQSPNPFVCLSLCLADRDLERHEVHHLITRLQSHDSEDEFEQDKNAMAILAFACHLQRHKSIYTSDSEYLQSLDSLLRNATWKLLNRMRDDGSFGSVYSTAIAAQALMSVNETRNWNPELTFNFLREHQKDDGSFGDFLATYLVLPALSGRSLLHLRNTQCTPPNSDRVLTPTEILAFRGPKHYVKYSIFIGNPKTNEYSIDVHVPVGIHFFDIMRVAAHKNDAFKFSYEETDGGIHVYSISNVPNDSERELEWNLFVTSRSNTVLDDPESLRTIGT